MTCTGGLDTGCRTTTGAGRLRMTHAEARVAVRKTRVRMGGAYPSSAPCGQRPVFLEERARQLLAQLHQVRLVVGGRQDQRHVDEVALAARDRADQPRDRLAVLPARPGLAAPDRVAGR